MKMKICTTGFGGSGSSDGWRTGGRARARRSRDGARVSGSIGLPWSRRSGWRAASSGTTERVKQLNLTDDQRKAMDGILQDHRMKLIDLQANLEKAEVEMGPLMKADTPDQTAIEAQIDKVAQARAELEKANARFLLDFRDAVEAGPVEAIADPAPEPDAARAGCVKRARGGWGQDGQRPGMGGPGNQFRGPNARRRRARLLKAPPPPPPARRLRGERRHRAGDAVTAIGAV